MSSSNKNLKQEVQPAELTDKKIIDHSFRQMLNLFPKSDIIDILSRNLPDITKRNLTLHFALETPTEEQELGPDINITTYDKSRLLKLEIN